MGKKIKEFLPVIFLSLVPTLLVWLPFFARIKTFWGVPLPLNGMATIVSNYDGPLYLVVAKSFYNPEIIKQFFEFPLPTEYYAAHFPLFPALIRLFSLAVGFPYAMLLVTILSSILAFYFFNLLIRKYLDKKAALLATAVFAIFPARWLIVRSIGSPEPLFMAGIIASIYFFQKKNYLLAAIWGMVAQLTKSPGILLFASYFAILATSYFKTRKINIKKLTIFLIPASLLIVFAIYTITLKDFFAYFHSGDNIHIFFPPFQIFNYSAPWVGTFWLEEIIFVYLFGILGFINLVKQKETVMAWFVGIFFATTIFVSHRDLIRYSLPVIPFLFVAFKETFKKRETKFVFAFLIIPIFLFSLAFLSQNVMPISNWSPFL